MRVLALGAVLAVGMAAVLAPAAGATLRVESTGPGGLVLTDKNGTFDDSIFLTLVTSGSGLEWQVSKTLRCGVACVDVNVFEIGPGCRQKGGEADGGVTCDRLGGRVTVNSLGGEDLFRIRPSSLTITDPITLNLGAGNDIGFGSSGNDTLNGGSGKDLLIGSAGKDALAGSTGDDALVGDTGDDTLLGGPDNDQLIPGFGADSADGGAGDDKFSLGTSSRDEKDQVQGGIGFDRATYTALVVANSAGDFSFTGAFGPTRPSPVRIVEANLETLGGEKDTDELDVLRSIEAYAGGAGNDIVTGVLSSNASDYFGETGSDSLFGTSGRNTLVGGAGADQLDGNDGADVIDAKSGEGSAAVADPLIDCGAGAGDLAILDLKDDSSPTGCEAIERAPAREKPHARPVVARVTRAAAGRLSFKIVCPRTQPGRCAGKLGLRIGRASTKLTRFSIRRGGSHRVAIKLGALEQRIGRHTVARLVSSEAGKIGPKTIVRRAVVRR